METSEIQIDQVFRDKDRRELSGNRHVQVAAFGTKRKRVAGHGEVVVSTAICAPVYLGGGGWQRHQPERHTIISLDNLRKRFELVTK